MERSGCLIVNCDSVFDTSCYNISFTEMESNSQSSELTASLLLALQLLVKSARRRRSIIRGRNRERIMKRHRKWQQLNRKWMSLERSLFREIACLTVLSPDFYCASNEPLLTFRYWEDTVEKLSSKEWFDYFRLSKETFLYLVKEMEPILCQSGCSGDFTRVDKRVAITLFSLASGTGFASIAAGFDVTKEYVVNVIKEVCETVVRVFMKKFVEVPSAAKLTATTTVFECEWNFPQCAGVVGAIHIPIAKESGAASEHINKNGWHSVILQTVVDPSYKFWDLNIGWPGSVSDSTVFMRSSLWEKGNEGSLFADLEKKIEGVNVPIILAADKSYPLADWVIKPYCDAILTEEQRNFNEKLSCIQENIASIAFRRLRARWKCLVKPNESSLELLPAVIASCCILHNICENRAEKVPKEWLDELDREQVYSDLEIMPVNTVIGDKAEEIRQALACYMTSMY